MHMIQACDLQHYSLFGGLCTDQVERILPYMEHAAFQAGEMILEEGKKNDAIYFLLEGRVAVLKSGRCLAELPEGQTFGEMELLDIMPAAASIKALLPVRVAVITNRALHQMYCLDVGIFSIMMMNLARDLSRRLRRMDELLVDAADAPSGCQ